MRYYGGRYRESEELTTQAELKTWPLGAPEFREKGIRLVADQAGISVLCLRGFSLQVIRTPGFSGVINSETVTPDASRRESLDFDGSEIFGRAKAAIRNQVSNNLTQRKNAGFVPEQIQFIEWCINSYGNEVLTNSEFPWLQIVEQSGNSRFISSSEFIALARDCDAIFLGLGLGVNGLSKSWKPHSQAPKRKELGVCFPQISISYERETVTGPLEEIWPLDSRRDDITLFNLFYETLCDEWGTSSSHLGGCTFIRNSGDISGFLTRT